jgi:Fe-S-cluster-containing hydrogenase component 2
MGKKLLIDMTMLRGLEDLPADAVAKQGRYSATYKTIRELAAFRFTCRHCENAPCLQVCPAEALEKDSNGVINRSLNLCIRCKSCIMACPFGTMTDDLFLVKTSGKKFHLLTDESDFGEFARLFPENVVRVVDMDENPGENIFELTETILIREKIWQ